GTLTGDQTSQIIKATAAKPHERKAKILKLVNTISTELAKDNPWNLELDEKMQVVDARILPPPLIQYGATTSAKPPPTVTPIEGVWSYPRLKFIIKGY
ncbi:hypothetical protein BC937DRAFT_94893, partial [Endogone sp. FLAS-F59071]